jgi:hypothetical protein
MFRSKDAKREAPPWMKPRAIHKPASGHHRIACGESCTVTREGRSREGMIWNLSVVGVYLVMEPPLPPEGETVQLRFNLPGDPSPIVCQARVRWQNAPSIFKGCGEVALALPPGCGLEFIALDARDVQRIEARVRTTLNAVR